MVRDEDPQPRPFRPLHLYPQPERVDVPTDVLLAVMRAWETSPLGWTARLLYEEIRAGGRDDIPEDLVHVVLAGGR